MQRYVYCCQCGEKVKANLVRGNIIYPHREDLYTVFFWQCPECKNYVGVHKNSKTKHPLGTIPTPEIRNARNKIHDILDPLWRDKRKSRKKRDVIYNYLSNKLGKKFHTAWVININEARQIYKWILEYKEIVK